MNCNVCGKSPAPYAGPSRLTVEQQRRLKAYNDSFKDGIHTGHPPLDLMELPYRLCEEHKPVSKGE